MPTVPSADRGFNQPSHSMVPLGLAIIFLLAVGQTIVMLVTDLDVLQAVGCAVGLVMAIFLLRGSRIAWVLILLGTLVGIGEGLAKNVGVGYLALGVLVAACLFIPSSFRYIWSERMARANWMSPESIQRPYDRAMRLGFGAIAYLASWEAKDSTSKFVKMRSSFKVLLWRLGFTSFTLFFISLITSGWQDERGDSQPIANIVANAVQIAFLVTLGAFGVVAFVALWQWIAADRSASGPTPRS